MDRASRDRQRVSLSVATSVAFFHLTGAQVDGRRDPETRKRLDRVARALANAAPIYAGDPPEALSANDLLDGEFHGGAQVFRTRDGREFNALAIERRDMLAAIEVLKAARIRLG